MSQFQHSYVLYSHMAAIDDLLDLALECVHHSCAA